VGSIEKVSACLNIGIKLRERNRFTDGFSVMVATKGYLGKVFAMERDVFHY
jgi:hypothetical protein